MLKPKIIANLHATSHIQDRWQQLKKKMSNEKEKIPKNYEKELGEFWKNDVENLPDDYKSLIKDID